MALDVNDLHDDIRTILTGERKGMTDKIITRMLRPEPAASGFGALMFAMAGATASAD